MTTVTKTNIDFHVTGESRDDVIEKAVATATDYFGHTNYDLTMRLIYNLLVQHAEGLPTLHTTEGTPIETLDWEARCSAEATTG